VIVREGFADASPPLEGRISTGSITGWGYREGVKGYSADQIRTAEGPLLAAGVPLMQRAANALAEEIASHRPGTVLLLVGSGDNGGDTLFAGQRLAASGISVGIARVGSRVHEAGFAAALAAGAIEVDPLEWQADVAVDGILGIGAAGPLRPHVQHLVLALKPRFVIAVDVPSGVDATSGAVDGPILRADRTITFGACKAGLLLEPGANYAGEVTVVDIGLDLSAVEPVVVTFPD
jgi:NAD(P)H-hydrate epimerase